MTAPLRQVVPPALEEAVAAWRFSYVRDCGDLSCGDLVLDLRQFVARTPPGARILVVARDPASVIDVPAWCRVTGHVLLAQAHPCFLIEKARA
jgi:tRNA 2-thiouridine synthesizing protein A